MRHYTRASPTEPERPETREDVPAFDVREGLNVVRGVVYVHPQDATRVRAVLRARPTEGDEEDVA